MKFCSSGQHSAMQWSDVQWSAAQFCAVLYNRISKLKCSQMQCTCSAVLWFVQWSAVLIFVQCIAVHWSEVKFRAVQCCSVKQRGERAVRCNCVEQCSAVQCSAVQFSEVQCSAAQCSATVWSSAVRCSQATFCAIKRRKGNFWSCPIN